MSPLSASAASSFAASTLTSLAARSVESDFDNFKDSFSSWDTCMSKAYCKWPVIAAIIVGSLIALSIITCAARCLCCGLECCFGCFACCNACCPSPRGRSKTTYVQAPQQQQPWPQPYTWQPNMAYGPPATATFDAPSGAAQRAAMVGNADQLPQMPSWQTAQSRRVEEEAGEDEGAAEETSLGETGAHAIPMGAVSASASAGRQAPAYGGAGAPVADDEEQRLPMLGAQPQRYDYGGSGYNYGEDTAYAPARSPVNASQGPYDSLPPRGYPVQQRQGQQQQLQQPRRYDDYPSPAVSPPATSPVAQTATPFSPYDYRINTNTETYNNSGNQNYAPYPDAHTSYASSIAAPSTFPPSYTSRAPTAAPSSPTYGSTAPVRYDANPYSWEQPRSPQGREESYLGSSSWAQGRPGEVARKPVTGSWREV